MKTADPVIDEIRRVRHQISESVGHDSKKLVELFSNKQRHSSDKLIFKAEKQKLPDRQFESIP